MLRLEFCSIRDCKIAALGSACGGRLAGTEAGIKAVEAVEAGTNVAEVDAGMKAAEVDAGMEAAEVDTGIKAAAVDTGMKAAAVDAGKVFAAEVVAGVKPPPIPVTPTNG